MYTVFDPLTRRMRRGPSDPLDPAQHVAPADPSSATRDPSFGHETDDLPVRPRVSRWRWVKRALVAGFVLFLLLVAYLAFTAPLSKSLQPPVRRASRCCPPKARRSRGAVRPSVRRSMRPSCPIMSSMLSLAIEDGGSAAIGASIRAASPARRGSNLWAGGVRQGGSTITQQLAKNAFLTSDRTAMRKMREVVIAFWLEAWLSKDQILSRYLSNVLLRRQCLWPARGGGPLFPSRTRRAERRAGRHAGGTGAGAPRASPRPGTLAGARARQKVVVGAMVDAGLLGAAGSGARAARADRAADDEQPAQRPPISRTGSCPRHGTRATGWNASTPCARLWRRGRSAPPSGPCAMPG